MFSGLLDRNKTFRPKHKYKKGTSSQRLYEHAKDTLGSGDLSQAVRCPPGEDLNEWLAINTVDFYNTTNLLYGSISEYCTSSMTAGSYEYAWKDGKNFKKATKLSAPDYVSVMMDWIAELVNNEQVFPSDPTKFPSNFRVIVETIFKRMFRVYAHLYYSHFDHAKHLEIDRHLNTAFKHFILFVNEFNLVDKQELEPLRNTITELTGKNLLGAPTH
ncbi:MOB kinase activator [Acrasis kona]|uniref:MOB kinase activator n=1 Tax=Acrasis kona TaxID=1008807 RepID=A0AAW2ZAB0_9EUKA